MHRAQGVSEGREEKAVGHYTEHDREHVARWPFVRFGSTGRAILPKKKEGDQGAGRGPAGLTYGIPYFLLMGLFPKGSLPYEYLAGFVYDTLNEATKPRNTPEFYYVNVVPRW